MRIKANIKKTISDGIRTIIPMLLFFVFYMVAFELLEHRTPKGGFHIIHLAIDDMIPYVEAFIIPYLMWFPFVAINIVFLAFCDKKAYTRMSWVLMAGMTVFIVFSAVYPNALNLRPAGFDHDNIFTRLILNLYSTDTPTNVAPSIHVFNSLAIAAGVVEWAGHRKTNGARVYAAVSCVIAILIVLSTMFIKQHSVVDVTSAVFFFAFSYYMCGVIIMRKEAVSSRRVRA